MEILSRSLPRKRPRSSTEARFQVAVAARSSVFYASTGADRIRPAIQTEPATIRRCIENRWASPALSLPGTSPSFFSYASLAPALASGCTVVGKLPGSTAQTNARMCEVFAEVKSLPSGVLNVFSELHGNGGTREWSISPTSRDQPSREVRVPVSDVRVRRRNLKRFGLELGGKTPVILFDDADLDKALPAVEKALNRVRGSSA